MFSCNEFPHISKSRRHLLYLIAFVSFSHLNVLRYPLQPRTFFLSNSHTYSQFCFCSRIAISMQRFNIMRSRDECKQAGRSAGRSVGRPICWLAGKSGCYNLLKGRKLHFHVGFGIGCVGTSITGLFPHSLAFWVPCSTTPHCHIFHPDHSNIDSQQNHRL